jgi:phenylpropionate dioxygenase-like ring-hydroxylating dioxygenase large terminal subunit
MTTTSAPRRSPASTGEATLYSTGRRDWATWPRYEAATLGFPNYWYPVTWSRQVGRRPLALTVMGQKIMLIRDRGVAYALADRCPHRGVPLSHPFASQEFPGTWSCCYHGWTYDLKTGRLVAAITDGPASPLVGKVAVRVFPVAERLGVVFVYMGAGTPPPLEADVPEELLSDSAVVMGRITTREGNWRFGAENGFDEGHAKYLHRRALWTLRAKLPVWTEMHVIRDGPWVTRRKDRMHYEEDFPGLGHWPPKKWWKRGFGNTARTSLRLPGALRVKYATWTHFEWYVPVDKDRHIYVQLATMDRGRLANLRFRLYYWSWVRWVFHGLFNDQDRLMVDVMDAPPERLYRPDVSITEWRRLAEEARPIDYSWTPDTTDGASADVAPDPIAAADGRSTDIR